LLVGGDVSDDEQLRDKARSLLQRERELFDLRKKHEQLAVWLNLGQALPELFLNRGASLDDVWDRVRRAFVSKLRLQRVVLLEIADPLRVIAPKGPARPLPPDLCALVESQRGGLCNDPSSSSNSPGVLALAETAGLHRFVWSRITRAGGPAILIVGGFDRTKAAFQVAYEDADVAHFSNAAQHVESLLASFLLVTELEREKDQLRQANQTLEQRDAALLQAAEELRAANESLELRVRDRTLELAGKNRDLRLVLDNVDQALLTVDLHGYLAPERSQRFDRWFGGYTGRPLFSEHVGADPSFALVLELGLEAIRDDFLPRDLCIDQLPSRFVSDNRHFDCRYLPIEVEAELVGLLLVIDDVTERLAREREETEQRELLAAFTALTRDRVGFLSFFRESERMFRELARPGTDVASEKRLLHTLKGNAGCYGLQAIADLCHRAESELDSECAVRAQTREQLAARWAAIVATINTVVPDELGNSIEVSEADLHELVERARRGASASQIIAALQRLRWEPVERPLGRLAQHARALAERLGKEGLDVQVVAEDLRLDPDRWAPLWSMLIHMVRNAVDHGIEPSERRLAAGKTGSGRLRLSARSLERGFVLAIEDDGRGIDWDSVRHICEERALPNHTRADLVRALLSAGFSTRTEVTDTSGRGIGLVATASLVRDFGGELSVESEPGTGTRWTLTFAQPSSDSLATLRAVEL
jgi:two-component system chemotaxis sensor kinase CheA